MSGKLILTIDLSIIPGNDKLLSVSRLLIPVNERCFLFNVVELAEQQIVVNDYLLNKCSLVQQEEFHQTRCRVVYSD